MKTTRILVVLALVLVVAVVGAFAMSPKAAISIAAITGIAGMSFSTQHNVGALVKVVRAAANTAVTAGGSGDAAEVTGATIDRLAHGAALSAVFAIPYSAVLAAGKKLKIAYTIEHGDASDLSDKADFVDVAAVTVATGAATTGSTETGCLEIPVDLAGAKRYVRILFTPDLDAAGTDTAALSAVCVLGGEDRIPAV
jgi:hypothetical protein